MLLLMLAVPSMTGVAASRRLKQSLDGFNDLVRQAHERSVTERRPYLIVWRKNSVLLRPEVFAEDEEVKPAVEFRLNKGTLLSLSLRAASARKKASYDRFCPIAWRKFKLRRACPILKKNSESTGVMAW